MAKRFTLFHWLWRCLAIACIGLLTACSAPATQANATVVPDKIVHTDAVPAQHIRFQLPGDTALAARVWVSPQPRHIVLGVHGFNDYSKAFEPLAQHLVSELQATVYAYDQRGFGANPQPGIWPGSNILLADLRHVVAQLRESHPGLPLTVVGESMGGAVVLVAASEAPGLAADQLILKAPAVWGAHSMPWYQRLSLYTMNLLAPEMSFTGRGLPSLGIRPTDDIEVSRDLGRDPLFIKATRVGSLAGVTELMGRAQNPKALPPQRSLVLYGLRDRIIPPQPVCDWLTYLNSSVPKTGLTDVVVYPEGWHLLTRQLRTREPLQDMAHWLQNTPLPHRQSTVQAQQVVCKGL
jgi:alpha-beta hydrolase superfamily lysophospholipase